MKFKQKIIPKVTIPESWKGVSSFELRKLFKEYYTKKIQGKTVLNKHLGLKITFSSTGKNKTGSGGAMYLYKAAIVQALPEILENAEFSNFAKKKSSDPEQLLGYFNFKAKVNVDGMIKHLRIATLFYQTEGRLFYSIEVNKY